MVVVKIHEAKTHLSRLIDRASKGEPFVIAKAGKPMVKVVPIDAPPEKKYVAPDSWRDTSRFPMISTPWRQKRSKNFLGKNLEPAARHAPSTVGSR